MITKLTEQKGCIIAEFIDLKRFTLAVTEEVKSELDVYKRQPLYFKLLCR